MQISNTIKTANPVRLGEHPSVLEFFRSAYQVHSKGNAGGTEAAVQTYEIYQKAHGRIVGKDRELERMYLDWTDENEIEKPHLQDGGTLEIIVRVSGVATRYHTFAYYAALVRGIELMEKSGTKCRVLVQGYFLSECLTDSVMWEFTLKDYSDKFERRFFCNVLLNHDFHLFAYMYSCLAVGRKVAGVDAVFAGSEPFKTRQAGRAVEVPAMTEQTANRLTGNAQEVFELYQQTQASKNKYPLFYFLENLFLKHIA